MEFGDQIKSIRTERKLTQEQMASILNVTRQAVSNWENNRNLPDIEMLITIASVFNLSIDWLILGGKNLNNMTEKLIRDGSEMRRAKMNLISVCIGATLLLFGIACVALKGASVEYIDTDGILQENFFLLPIGFLFLLSSFVIFFITGIKNTLQLFGRQRNHEKNNIMTYIGICLSVILLLAGGFLVLLEANAGKNTAIVGLILMGEGIICLVFVTCKIIVGKKHRNTEKCQ